MDKQYQQYLESPLWAAKRKQRMSLDNYKCAFCGSNDDLQVHHMTYSAIGSEDVDNDLITLCGKCHSKIHVAYKNACVDIEKAQRQFCDDYANFLASSAEYLQIYNRYINSIGEAYANNVANLFIDVPNSANGKLIGAMHRHFYKGAHNLANKSFWEKKVGQKLHLSNAYNRGVKVLSIIKKQTNKNMEDNA